MRGVESGMIKNGIATLTGNVQVHLKGYRDDPAVENSITDTQTVEAVLEKMLPPRSRWASRVRVSALSGDLPAELPFANILDCRRANGEAILTVENCAERELQEQAERVNCQIDIQSLPLEDIYRIVVG